MTGRNDYRGRAALLQLGRDLVDALHAIADSLNPAPPALAAEELLCRHLGGEHLGRWVLVPGRPGTASQQRDPAGLTVAGRLVGLEPGEYPQTTTAGVSRTLILLQGGKSRSLLVPVDAVVRVSPREWS